MKRRDFIKNGSITAGLVGSSSLLFTTAEGCEQNASRFPGYEDVEPEEIRSADYLRRVQSEQLLSKLPQLAKVQFTPMSIEERIRRKIIPRKGFCCLAPAGDTLLSGNGSVTVKVAGNPYSERIPFSHESLFTPRNRAETAKIAHVFPQVRKMMLEGKYHEAVMIGYNEWQKDPVTRSRGFGPSGFSMSLEYPASESAKNYLRTIDFESTEIKVYWSDERGDWVRETFSSRPDNVVVQRLTAPSGQSLNVRITMSEGSGAPRRGGGGQDFAGIRSRQGSQGGSEESNNTQTVFNEQWLIIKGLSAPQVDNRGYANVTRVVQDGGSAHMEGDTLVVEDAGSVLLLTRIEYFPEYSDAKAVAVQQSLGELTPDYPALLERARKVQSERLNRVTVDFGDDSKYGLSSEELISDQQSSPGYSGAFLKTFFEMCRYWFILYTGKYLTISGLTNVNTNLQIAVIPWGNYHESEMAYFDWVESLVPDYRSNAKNIYGFRGTHYPIAPSKDSAVFNMFDYADNTGETWPHPYWISAGGWVVRPFWDHYLVTGDLEFLRNRMVPIYKELALFYEDYLTLTDDNGKYIFVPSFSPENNPRNLNPGCMAVINATMDITVCREVLVNLIESCELLGIEGDNILKWKAMVDKLPPYLENPDGSLKEWAWPDLDDRDNHRHISTGYGAWPGDEIDPDRTPELAKALVMADRKRVPERLAAHSRCQRALIGARLKDNYMVDSELRQLIEQGFVSQTLICPHDPYANFALPDAQGGIPAIMMEMLAYSRPGVIEVLPALPPTLVKGAINGMLLKTFAQLDKLSWDMRTGTVDLTVTSRKEQQVTLIARYGIEEITVSSGVMVSEPGSGEAACDLNLPKGEAVDIHMKIGQRDTLDWINWV